MGPGGRLWPQFFPVFCRLLLEWFWEHKSALQLDLLISLSVLLPMVPSSIHMMWDTFRNPRTPKFIFLSKISLQSPKLVYFSNGITIVSQTRLLILTLKPVSLLRAWHYPLHCLNLKPSNFFLLFNETLYATFDPVHLIQNSNSKNTSWILLPISELLWLLIRITDFAS